MLVWNSYELPRDPREMFHQEERKKFFPGFENFGKWRSSEPALPMSGTQKEVFDIVWTIASRSR